MSRQKVITFLILVVSYPGFSQVSKQEKPVNIIVVLADDLGWADVAHDGSGIDTPSLDELAAEGVQLTSFYSSASLCSPARAALLTGRYPHSVGMPDLASPVKRNHVPVLSLDHAAITIPEALKSRGYTSMLAGKWHLGHHEPNWPRTHGFDEFRGSLIGTPGYYDAKETYHNETPVKVDGYFTDHIAAQAVEFIKKEKDGPFFLYVAFNAPHYPLEAPASLVYKYRSRFPDKGLYAIYAAMVEQMDKGIGSILSTLDSLDLENNTLVIFCSDNGPSAEPKSYGLQGARISAGPLRGHKFSTHEGGIRVPFLARWPGKIPAGTRRSEPAIMMDLMPTFLDACNIKPARGHEMHGVSVLPLLMGRPFERKSALHWEDQYNMAVRKDGWKLVHRFYSDQPYLYKIADDASEENDLAEDNPKVVAELLAEHEKWARKYYPNRIPHVTKRSNYIFPEK